MDTAAVRDSQRKIWINGEDIRSHGIRVLRLPPIMAREKRVRRYEIPGRSGYLTVDTGAWEELPLEAVLFYEGPDPHAAAQFIQTARDVRFGNDPDRVYDCLIKDGFILERLIREWHRFPVIFRCGLKREITETVLTGTSITLDNETNTISFPRIEVTASGTVIINIGTKTLTVTGVSGTLVLDSLLGIAWDDNGSAWTRLTGDLPEIGPGESVTISSTHSLKIGPQWRWA